MGVFDRQIATATRLIAAKGQACVWQQVPTTTPDPSKPWEQQNSAMTPYNVKIAFLPASSPLLRLIQGSNIASSRTRGLMAAVGFTPSIADTVQRGSEILRLCDLDAVNINGEIILWKMEFEP